MWDSLVICLNNVLHKLRRRSANIGKSNKWQASSYGMLPTMIWRALCDVLLITMHSSGYCCFSDINISHGHVTTCFRCGGICFAMWLLKIYCWVYQLKNFENQPAFSEVRAKNGLCRCDICNNRSHLCTVYTMQCRQYSNQHWLFPTFAEDVSARY